MWSLPRRPPAQPGSSPRCHYSFRFQTVGFLNVSQTLPADGAEEVDVASTITVMFNRPVVPLVHSSQMGDLPSPLSFDPPVDGEGEWLNTSIYVFRPEGTLAAGVEYQAVVAAGLEDLTGGVLAEDYTWTFTTQTPQIVWSRPELGESNIGLTDPISITFNQPMDRASTEAAFSIHSEDDEIPAGSFSWNEDGTEMGWRPVDLLALETRYLWELNETAQSAGGAAKLDSGLVSSFWAVSYPALLFTNPRDGTTRADPYGGVELYFASPMDPKTIMPNLTIIPEPTSVYTWYDDWDNRFYSGFDKLPSTAYTVTVGAEMADPYGNQLDVETVVHFTTGRLEPMAYLNTPGQLGTYNAYTRTVIYAAYRNVDQLDLTLARLDSRDLIRLTGPGSWQAWDNYRPSGSSIVRQWTVPVQNELNQTLIWRIPLVDEVGDSLSPGVYYLSMTSPGFSPWQVSRHVLVVSRINLTIKAAADEVLVWATDLVSGRPVAGLPVSIYDGENNWVADGIDRRGWPGIDQLRLQGLWICTPSRPSLAAAALQPAARSGRTG